MPNRTTDRTSKRAATPSSAYDPDDSRMFKPSFKHTRADEQVLDRICASNMRLAKVLAPTIILAVLGIAILSRHLITALAPTFQESVLFAAVSAGMIVASLVLFMGARRYEQGELSSRGVAEWYLAIFVAMGYLYAIVVSTASYYAVNRMSLFYISMIVNAVLLVFIPPIQTLVSVGAMVAFITTFNVLGMNSVPLTCSCLVFLIAIIAAGAMRYREQRRGVAATLEAENSSQTDALTGLHNRMAFDLDLPHYANRDVAIAMTDVDDFKYFNDAYSHDMGDRVLKSFARALIDSFPTGIPYRYGGDEFVVLAELQDETDFPAMTQTFLTEVGNIRLGPDDSERVSASLGYALGHPHTVEELHNLLHLADRKLYESKRNGKGQATGIDLNNSAILPETISADGLPFLRSYEVDPLTDLPNMQYFRAHALQAVEHVNSTQHDAVLMHFDLINFKLINERQGYQAGDHLLCVVADAIRTAFPRMLAARIAEDRFVVICPQAAVEEGFTQAQETVNAHKHEPATELKAGVFRIQSELDDIGNAYDAAKIACDSIKQVHGQALRFYDEELQHSVERRRYVLDHIGEAIRNNHLVVHYQPVFRASTTKLCGCEALVRWKDERYGMIPPFEFIGLLESSQQINELDRYVVAHVCDDWKAVKDAGEPMQPVSVNFSRIDFQLIDVVSLVEENTQRVGMPRAMLHVEVTESAFTDADDRLQEQIARLRQLGYQVWMDDFGSGYSSLNQLEWHDFDVAKIDMAFMRNFENPQVRSMLTSLVDMIKRLGVQTLVEGVETKEQLEFMRSIGCEFIQGYYLGKPMDLTAFRALLTDPADKVEPFSQRGYYDAVGRVNPLSQDPFDFDSHRSLENKAEQQGLALATAEWQPGHLRYLSINRAFRELVQYLGLPWSEDADFFGTSVTLPVELDRLLQSTCTTNRELAFDFTVQGENCVIHTKMIAAYRGVYAVLITLEDRSRTPGHTLRSQFDMTIRYVYSLYDIIDIIDRATGIISNVYSQAASLLSPSKPEMLLSEASILYAQEYIHPADRDRYLEYIRMDTLDARLAQTDQPYLTDAFRALSSNGSYHWTVTVLIPMETKDGQFLVLCRRHADFGLVRRYQDGSSELGNDLLWSAAMQLLPEKVFWKDRQRRFLGANKHFLEYYGFDSLHDILGKTDEELGWNLDDDAFCADEKEVIEQGKTIVNRSGITVVQGQPRPIVTNKAPLKRNGAIKGLVGFFTDLEEELEARGHVIALTTTDQMTGLLNGIGVRDTLSRFEQSLCEKGPDYGLVYLDIDNLRDINREYGYTFGNRVLAQIGAALIEAIDTCGIIGRIRTDEFVIIRQFTDDDAHQNKRELNQLAVQARDAIAGITSVDATPCHTDASYGYALRSETDATMSLLRLAESRMRDERHLRAAASAKKFSMLTMTVSDVKRYMQILMRNYDRVRLINPSTCQARELTDRNDFGESYRCFALFGRETRCVNCICARTLGDFEGHEKYEPSPDGTVLVHSQYVTINGTGYVLEMITNLSPRPASLDGAKDADATNANDVPLVSPGEKDLFDEATGAFSVRYLEETLMHLHGHAVAAIALDPPVDETGAGTTDASSHDTEAHAGDRPNETEAMDAAARTAVMSLRNNVRPNDAIVRINDRLLAVVFDGNTPQINLKERLSSIQKQLATVDAPGQSQPGIRTNIGAINRKGTVEELLHEAERNVYRAKASTGLYVTGE